MSIKALYRAHFLLNEAVISFSAALLFVIILLWEVRPSEIEEWIDINSGKVYPVVATISGTLLGFVIAGVSVIVAFSESKRFRLLKKSKHYETVFQTYLSAIKYLSVATVSSTVAIFARDDLALLAIFLVLFSTIASSFRIWRCLWVLREFISIARSIDDVSE